MPDIYVAKKEQESERVKEQEEKQITNPLSAFVQNPVGVRFETQEEEEKIILLLRKHWITNVPWIILAIILLAAPLVLPYFPLLTFLPVRYQLMAVILWYLLVTAFVFEQFLTWFFNVYIVTDERVVDVDFYNLVYKQITEAKIDRIQDITLRLGGVVRALFNFGDVLIQTAGAEPNLEFEAVPNPDQVVKILQGLRTEEEVEALEGRVR
ncbi:MAG: hypothetical protein ACOZBZ_00975 [Patescibacteria group bacterium]